MTYSRSCGVSVSACAASECRCVSMPADTVGAPEKPAQRFGPCDRPDCPICTARQATPPQAIQPLDPMRHVKAHTAALAAIQRSIDTRE